MSAASLTPSPTLRTALESLRLQRLSFSHRLAEEAQLPVLKGDLWRSVFGNALHQEAPATAALLMGEDRDEAARPWAITGPEVFDEWIPEGSELHGSLLLIGAAAIAARPDCVRALAAMAKRSAQDPQRGLGPLRGGMRAQAELMRVAEWLPDGGTRLLTPEEALGLAPRDSATAPTDGSDAWTVWRAAAASVATENPQTAGLRLQFATPLRLKQHGGLYRAPPPLSLLVQRLFGRLVHLLPPLPGGVFEPREKESLLAWASDCPLESHAMGGLGWNRYSARQKREMPFEGLIGTAVYAPPSGLFLPWFELASWLQIGAKTTFGFGVVRSELVRV